MSIVLGANQYGKAEVRLVRVDRDTPRHRLTDLSVTSQLRGDFAATHLTGDNSGVIATDTQKNTVYAFARDGVGSPETFLARLARHFLAQPQVTGGRWAAEQYTWERIGADGAADPGPGSAAGRELGDAAGREPGATAGPEPGDAAGRDPAAETGPGGATVPKSGGAAGHDHAFVRSGGEKRTALVHAATPAGGVPRLTVLAGLRDATLLKSTGSEFHGFPRDRYTTLPEVTDRILATDVTAWWRYTDDFAADALDAAEAAAVFDARYDAVRSILLESFAGLHSLALQQTVFAMGRAVLEEFDDIAEIRLSCPNNHHFLVDLEPFGLDNPGEVFFAADRPYGLIEAAVTRSDDEFGGGSCGEFGDESGRGSDDESGGGSGVGSGSRAGGVSDGGSSDGSHGASHGNAQGGHAGPRAEHPVWATIGGFV